MNFGNALGQLALGAGNALIYGQQYNQRQAEIENTKSNTQLHQMEALAMKRTEADRAALANDVAVETKAQGDGLKTQQDIGKIATYAESKALARGDLTGAKTMASIAENAQTQQKQQMVQQSAELQQKKEATAAKAADYLVNPTPDNAQEIVRSAIQAGADPSKIPMASDPKFQTWVKEQSLAAIPSAERLKFLQETKKTEEAHAEKVREFNEREKDRAVQRQMLAEQREQNNLFKKEQLELMRQRAQDRKEAAASKAGGVVKTHPAQVESGIQMIVGSAGEAIRGLDAVSEMASTQTGGMFAELKQGTLLEALNRGGTSLVTPQSQKLYETAIGGIATEMTRVITGGGGRSGGQQLADELRKILRVEPGDTEAIAMYKFANGIDIVRNRLQYLDDSDSPKMKSLQRELESKLEKYPHPQEILKAIKGNPALTKQFNTKAPTLLETLGKAKAAVHEADSKAQQKPEAESPAPALPAGWK